MFYYSRVACILVSALLTLSWFDFIACAQPPQNEVMAVRQRYEEAPETAVRWLAFGFNRKGDLPARASRVVEANPDNPLLRKLDEEVQRARGTFLLSTDNYQVELNGKEATITFRTTLRDNLLNQVSRTESLQLRQFETEWQTFWKVIPGTPKAVMADPDSGILLRLATFIAYPEEMLSLTQAAVSHSNMEKLANGMMGLLQDYDERFALKADELMKILPTYVASGQLFYAPADKSGQVSYSFNANLRDKHIHEIVRQQTVMLYEGHDEQLAFRYENKALVALCDGTVKFVTPEEAKLLRWKP